MHSTIQRNSCRLSVLLMRRMVTPHKMIRSSSSYGSITMSSRKRMTRQHLLVSMRSSLIRISVSMTKTKYILCNLSRESSITQSRRWQRRCQAKSSSSVIWICRKRSLHFSGSRKARSMLSFLRQRKATTPIVSGMTIIISLAMSMNRRTGNSSRNHWKVSRM